MRRRCPRATGASSRMDGCAARLSPVVVAADVGDTVAAAHVVQPLDLLLQPHPVLGQLSAQSFGLLTPVFDGPPFQQSRWRRPPEGVAARAPGGRGRRRPRDRAVARGGRGPSVSTSTPGGRTRASRAGGGSDGASDRASTRPRRPARRGTRRRGATAKLSRLRPSDARSGLHQAERRRRRCNASAGNRPYLLRLLPWRERRGVSAPERSGETEASHSLRRLDARQSPRSVLCGRDVCAP